MSQNYNVKQSDYSQIRLTMTTPSIDVQSVSLFSNPFCLISLDGFGKQTAVGKPALPSMVKTIEVPLGDGLRYEILSIEQDTLDGNAIGITTSVAPAQPSRSKSDRSVHTIVMDNDTYTRDAFCGEPTIVVKEIGVARDRNLATIAFNPIKWNPVSNQVVVVRSVTVAIRQRNADIEATKRMKSLHANGNYGYGIDAINSLDDGIKEVRSGAPVRYTIVAHSMFRGALDEFASWKRRKGFMVDLVYTDDQNVGSTTTSISRYLSGLYDNATEAAPAPTYVLLVGDIAQIPAFQLTTQNTHSSDLNYVCWTSGDKIPDAYIGRFSAQDLNQLAPQISKTLMYEQYSFPDDSYLNRATLIAGVDGGSSGDFGYTHADPTMDYVAYNYVNSSNGYTSVTYYKNNTTRHPDGVTVTGSSQASGTAAALKSLYNNGCGLVNYSAHGDKTMWATPQFTVSDVENMTNQDKPMVMIGNCCLTNSYQIAACLGEALLRKGNNAGAVAYIGASEVTYWDEDVYWSMGPRSQISATMSTNYNAGNLGMYDRLFHTHGEAFSAWHITTGAMMFAGNMAVQSSTAETSMKNYYWEIYHLMGDPSVMPYIHGQAQTMTVTAPDVIPLGQNNIEVQAAPYAYVALTDEELNLIAAAYADASGNATLSISNSDNITSGNYEIAASAQGYRQQFKAVTIMPIGTYVKAIDMVPSGNVEAGKTVAFDITLKNIGIEAADSLWIEFRSANDNILIDTTGIIALNGGLDADAEMTLGGRCSALVWNDVADQKTATISVILRWSQSNDVSKRSTARFNFPINAPKVITESHSLAEATGSTQTSQLTIVSRNDGHAPLPNATASILCLDPTITVSGDAAPFSLSEQGQITKQYTVTTTETEPINRIVPMLYTIANDDIQFTDSLMVVFGIPYENITFNDGTWGDHTWTQGTYPWEITSSNPYEGNYCIRSKTWNANAGSRKTSDTRLSFTTSGDDSISFYYRVSSEEDYDKFNFYIDNTLMLQESGEVGWTRASYPVTAGSHTLRFAYAKDYYAEEGEDAAFVDNLRIPLSGTAYIYINDTICSGAGYTLLDTTLATGMLDEGTHQITITRNDVVYGLTLTIMPMPQPAIQGGDVTIDAGETVRLTATGGSRYIWNSGERHPVIDIYPTRTTTYTVTAYNGRCSAEASTVVNVNGTVGIDSDPQPYNHPLLVYPNPAHNSITISYKNLSRIVITDITGRILIARELGGASTQETETTIDISNLSNGIHLIQAISNDGMRAVSKFIKN